jgi:hypothetical protein
VQLQLGKSSHWHDQNQNIREDVDRSHSKVSYRQVVTALGKSDFPSPRGVYPAFESLSKSAPNIFRDWLTHVYEGHNDGLDGNEARNEVYGFAKFGLREDAMVESQDTGFHEE